METLEYYYALASPWSFLGNQKLIVIADKHQLTIDPIIIDYDKMFTAAKTVPLPERPILRKEYRLADLRRWAAFRNIEFNVEPKFYRGEVEEPNEREGALMVVAAKEEGLDSLKLAHAVSRALWAEERFPFHKDELIRIADREGFDGSKLWQRSKDTRIADAYAENTQKSIDQGVFGMPFYVARGQRYWGQYRLELMDHVLADGQ